ncbi:prepilin peptidase [Thermocrinis minervae]|uniref:Prepilin leader peptidase/N-methyltransferase n=1 Tax=Thermocrinis minervae TaxID=381751 RepID=A0A1M6TFG6_9AQUI|nr:A24 family peptidase [Thermocrinis minervae]SHK55508.1 type 4 prepilin peptidase 1 Aspartic peptidase. MEROPS family A24A [Thermocrinis minervae]
MFEYVLLFVIGSVLGSFYNVLIYRIPRGMSIIRPGSSCPKCGSSIKFYDNIPIISYLILRGRCRYCGEKISLRYPVVEFLSGALACLSYYKWGATFEAFVYFVFFSLLLILSFIDWQTFTLPDSLTLGGLAFGLITSFFRHDLRFPESLLGSLLGGGLFLAIYLFYVKVRKMEGLGFGDVKLMAFIGSVGGPWAVIFSVSLGSILGLLYAIPIILKHRSFDFVIPYGPFLSLGAFLGLVFKDYLLSIF